MNKIIIGLIFAVLSTLFYSFMDTSIKWTLYYTNISTVVLYTHVNILILLFLTVFLLLKFNISLFALKVRWYIMLYRGGLAFANFYLAYIVLQMLPLDIYYSVIFTVPTIASILSVIILKEKLSYIKVFSLCLGLIGVLIISNPLNTNFSISYIKPILLALLLAISISLAMISTKQYFSNYDNTSLTFYIFLICSILGIITNFVNNKQPLELLQFNYNFSITIIIALACLIGFIFFIQAYKNVSTQILAPTEYLYIVWGTILGKIVFEDNITISTIIGAFVVIFSNILVFIENKKAYN